MQNMPSLIEKVSRAPKAELHVHIEGTLEPELIFKLAQRNNVALAWSKVEDLRQAYQFTSLQSFLDIYYAGTSVLQTEEDFYEMTAAYIDNAHQNGVIHAEIFFDPQSHTSRGIGFDVFIPGMIRALESAREKGMTTQLIMCFLRHLPESDALKTFEDSREWFSRHPEWLTGVGLDSSENGNPPEKFARVFAMAKEAGLRRVAHAGEEGPVEYIWQALQLLESERIDHGVRSLDDPELIAHLSDTQMPLTVCPLSNVKLRVFDTMADHNLRELLQAGVNVTINSDDPAYFGGHVNENYQSIISALQLTENECYTLLKNSLISAFVNAQARDKMLMQLNAFWHADA
ncbi:adenosine deaminase [Mangrovibacter yixingensis]|uniref:adenosine deaminase n=1 Tax=Mangrovibacter yixingensis TaxID=1529639 RepID=UPI001CF9ACBA|nr:adenosine deaminase [Mangrovibacter yixingensis]